MKKFKIIKVKRYWVEDSNGISLHKQWEKQRDINSEQEKILRISPKGYVERLEIELQCPDNNLVNGIKTKLKWVKDDNYEINWENELSDAQGDPWKQFVNRHLKRKHKDIINLGEVV